MKAFLADERAQGDWSSIYLLLVLVIAALILISIIKPMYQQSKDVVTRTKKAVQDPNN